MPFQDEITSAGIGAEESAASSTPATNGNKVVAHKTPLPIPLAKNPNQLDVNIYLGRVNTYINSLGFKRKLVRVRNGGFYLNN